MMKKRNVVWHSCDLCSHKCKSKVNLKQHKQSIHDIDVVWHSCDLCSYKCKKKGHLKQHKQSIHKHRPCTLSPVKSMSANGGKSLTSTKSKNLGEAATRISKPKDSIRNKKRKLSSDGINISNDNTKRVSLSCASPRNALAQIQLSQLGENIRASNDTNSGARFVRFADRYVTTRSEKNNSLYINEGMIPLGHPINVLVRKGIQKEILKVHRVSKKKILIHNGNVYPATPTYNKFLATEFGKQVRDVIRTIFKDLESLRFIHGKFLYHASEFQHEENDHGCNRFVENSDEDYSILGNSTPAHKDFMGKSFSKATLKHAFGIETAGDMFLGPQGKLVDANEKPNSRQRLSTLRVLLNLGSRRTIVFTLMPTHGQYKINSANDNKFNIQLGPGTAIAFGTGLNAYATHEVKEGGAGNRACLVFEASPKIDDTKNTVDVALTKAFKSSFEKHEFNNVIIKQESNRR